MAQPMNTTVVTTVNAASRTLMGGLRIAPGADSRCHGAYHLLPVYSVSVEVVEGDERELDVPVA